MKKISLHELYELKQQLLILQMQKEKKLPNHLEIEDEILQIQEQLRFSNVVSYKESDTISLGSVFKASFSNGDLETFMLVEKPSFKEPQQHFIELGSNFGNSIIGKKEGEHFSYQENGTLVNGTIMSIMKKENYQKVKK